MLVSAARSNHPLKIMHNKWQRERDGFEGDRWPRVRKWELAFHMQCPQKTLFLFVCLFAALSVMQSAYFHWFHLFIFICFSLSARPKHLKSNTVHLQSLNSLLQQSCGVKLFLSGSQAVSHDWTKKKSALCPLLNMNNKSIHPRSPLSLSAESCWLGPLLYFFSVLFCYSCPSQ